MRREEHLDPDDLDRPDWNSLKSNYDKHDIGEAYFKGRVEQMGLTVEHWGIDMRNEDDSLVFDNKMDLRLWRPLDGQTTAPDAGDGFRGTEWARSTLDGDHRAYEIAMDRDLEPASERIGEESWALEGVADVKTKANPDWLGVLNLRHLAHYAEHADAYDVPVFLYFTMVDMDSETVGDENILIPVPTDWNYHAVADHFDHHADFSLSWGALKDMARECAIVDRVFRAPDGNPVVQTRDETYNEFDWFEEQL
jgi:hypothetical protein